MPLKDVDVEVRWEDRVRDLSQISEEEASSQDGLYINHVYNDYRGMTIEDAIEALQEEEDLLSELAAADWDTEEAEEVIESHMAAFGLTAELDAGVAGLVYALSAIGATPLSSCNGGLVGISYHSSDVPHVLFTAPPAVIDKILIAAKGNGVGLIRNGEYAEAFTNHLPKLHALAKELVGGAASFSLSA